MRSRFLPRCLHPMMRETWPGLMVEGSEHGYVNNLSGSSWCSETSCPRTRRYRRTSSHSSSVLFPVFDNSVSLLSSRASPSSLATGNQRCREEEAPENIRVTVL